MEENNDKNTQENSCEIKSEKNIVKQDNEKSGEVADVKLKSGEGAKKEKIENDNLNENDDNLKKHKSRRKRVLSDGEFSSGIETVSSADITEKRKEEILDFDLTSTSEDEEDEYRVIVEIKNELAFQNSYGENETYDHYESDYESSIKSGSKGKSDYYSGESANFRNDKYKNGDSPRGCKQKKKGNRHERWSKDGDNYGSYGHYKHRRNTECVSRKSRRSRSSDKRLRSRSSDKNHRSRSSDKRLRSRSSDKRLRSRSSDKRCRSRTPEYRNCKRRHRSETANDGNFNAGDSAKLDPKRKHYPKNDSKFSGNQENKFRKQEPLRPRYSLRGRRGNHFYRNFRLPQRRWNSSESISPDHSFWNAFDGNNQKYNRDFQKDSSFRESRKKERTPFLVELEKKLKEAEFVKNNIINKPTVEVGNVQKCPALAPQYPVPHSSLPKCAPSFPSHVNPDILYPVQHPSIPSVSVDNLPLVAGPRGLPVHITMTGEHIPHDMDGRRIPVGPSGHYLPLDPSGRLFAHIVSPGNVAVPVHMTEDGVLRLPNRDPVPVGPPHNRPVNIDGSVIVLGPDSRPIYPCPNLPTQPPPPVHENISLGPMEASGPFSGGAPNPQMFNHPSNPNLLPLGVNCTANQRVATQSEQKAKENILLSGLIQNSDVNINKGDLVKKYRQKAEERKKTENKFGVNRSKRGVKRSIALNLIDKKVLKEDNNSSGSDMVLDSGDSEPGTATKCTEPSETDSLGSDKSDSDVSCDKSSSSECLGYDVQEQITKKVQQAINSLTERDFQPVFSRFILPKFYPKYPSGILLNESPLLRNRVNLQFLTPNSINLDNQETPESPGVSPLTFRFLSPRETTENSSVPRKRKLRKRRRVFTFDSETQCDLTELNCEIRELEKEIARLKSMNENLVETVRNLQGTNQIKSQEGTKALDEIEMKNVEIQQLKGDTDVKEKSEN